MSAGAPARAVVATAPMRITLAGGGTDLPEYYRHGPTQVLAITVDLTVRVAVAGELGAAQAAAAFEPDRDRYRLELGPRDHSPYRDAAAALLGISPRVAVAVSSRVRPGSGLGGSGAFCVALLDALAAANGVPLAPAAAAELAYRVERERLGRPVGSQDGWVAATGGAVRLDLSADGAACARHDPEVFAVVAGMLDRDLLLFSTPTSRDAGRVLAGAAPVTSATRAAALRAAYAAERAFRSGDVTTVGRMLRCHWAEKVRRNPAADHPACHLLAARADELGVHGFKLLGAGGGGHVLAAVDPARRQATIAALAHAGLEHVPVRPRREGLVPAVRAGGVRPSAARVLEASCVSE